MRFLCKEKQKSWQMVLDTLMMSQTTKSFAWKGQDQGRGMKKKVNDDKKNIKSMIQLFNNVIVSEASERRQIYTGLRVYGATAYKPELSLTMLDFRGM